MKNLMDLMKNNKNIKRLAFLCIIVGVITVISGCALADFQVINLNTNIQDEFVVKQESFSKQDLKNISINADHASIYVEPIQGDEIKIEYAENEDYPMHFKQDGSTLSISRGEEAFSLSKIFQFQWFHFNQDSSINITVQIPEDYAGNLSLDHSYGTLHMEDFTTLEEVSVDSSHGVVELSNLKMNTLDISSSYSSVAMDSQQIATDLRMDVDHDALTMKDVQAVNIISDLSYCTANIEKSHTLETLRIDNDHGTLDMDLIETKDLIMSLSYTPSKIGSIHTSNLMDLDLDHDNIEVTDLNVNHLKIVSSYVDVKVQVGSVKDVSIDSDHGDVTMGLTGSISDYYIMSQADHGDNNLPSKLNPSKEEKLNIITNYGNIDVSFLDE